MSNNVQEMKKIIKPLIKECLTEILVEQGLTSLIKENTVSQPAKQVFQQPSPVKKQLAQHDESLEEKKRKLREHQEKMLKEIGASGFDPFAGTEPIVESNAPEMHDSSISTGNLMAGISGAGVDISRLMNANKKSWNFYNNALSKGGKKMSDE